MRYVQLALASTLIVLVPVACEGESKASQSDATRQTAEGTGSPEAAIEAATKGAPPRAADPGRRPPLPKAWADLINGMPEHMRLRTRMPETDLVDAREHLARDKGTRYLPIVVSVRAQLQPVNTEPRNYHVKLALTAQDQTYTWQGTTVTTHSEVYEGLYVSYKNVARQQANEIHGLQDGGPLLAVAEVRGPLSLDRYHDGGFSIHYKPVRLVLPRVSKILGKSVGRGSPLTPSQEQQQVTYVRNALGFGMKWIPVKLPLPRHDMVKIRAIERLVLFIGGKPKVVYREENLENELPHRNYAETLAVLREDVQQYLKDGVAQRTVWERNAHLQELDLWLVWVAASDDHRKHWNRVQSRELGASAPIRSVRRPVNPSRHRVFGARPRQPKMALVLWAKDPLGIVPRQGYVRADPVRTAGSPDHRYQDPDSPLRMVLRDLAPFATRSIRAAHGILSGNRDRETRGRQELVRIQSELEKELQWIRQQIASLRALNHTPKSLVPIGDRKLEGFNASYVLSALSFNATLRRLYGSDKETWKLRKR